MDESLVLVIMTLTDQMMKPWAMVSGKNDEDHMILYNELQNSMTSKLLSLRGEKWKA